MPLKPMAIRMCETLDREFHADNLDDHWTELVVEPGEPADA